MTIYGECEAQGRRLKVQIRDLAGSGCGIASESGEVPVDGDLSLWIGAIGPLAATAMRLDETHMSALFKEPLDDRILKHFALD